ncbi:unnamed protein product [Cuscuta campestris]|uniref:Uncharacterized protein n=1 Tax=Cuscuta campestris TaxID=132261 RepID=A0A484M3V3_9ASTE|nr:unnamed protein product [Cuscuta campestris]
MNSIFDGYVHSKTSLSQFVEQYERALRKKPSLSFSDQRQHASTRGLSPSLSQFLAASSAQQRSNPIDGE